AVHDLDGAGIAFVVLGHQLEELAPLLALRLVPVRAHAITPPRSRSRSSAVAAIRSRTQGLLPARPGPCRPVRTAAASSGPAGTVARPRNARIRRERRTMAALQTIEAGTLLVASAFPDPPFEVEKDGVDTGFDAELMRAVRGQVGLRLQLRQYEDE